MFPDVPEDLSSLGDDDLATLLDELVGAFNEATADDADLNDEVVAGLAAVADSVERLRSEQDHRAEVEEARRGQIAQLNTRVNVETETETTTEGADGDGGSGDDPDKPAENEPQQGGDDKPETQDEPASQVAASHARPRRASTRAPARMAPRPSDNAGPSIVAAADVPGVVAGSRVTNMRQVAEMMTQRQRGLGKGNGDHVPVVQFQRNVPTDRHIDRGMSPAQINDRLSSFSTAPDSIRAAGGLCAPVNTYYEQEVIAGTGRPVRDALANFTADRGGIRFNPSPTMADITSGVEVLTPAQEALPVDDEDFTPKSSFTVTCHASEEVVLAAIYTQLKFGNFGARAWPEAVEAWQQTALAVAARTAETYLLDRIAAGSTAVTTTGLTGAGREVFARLGQAAAGYRSFERMSASARLTVLLPAWTLALVSADFARTFTDDAGFISMSDADITALFGTRNLDVYWYLDSKTGGGQVWDPNNAGALRAFPAIVYSYLFPTGAFLHLDGGTLDLGLVRDSTLNSANQFTTFVESWEEVAHVGHRSLEVRLTLDPNGSYAAAVDTIP